MRSPLAQMICFAAVAAAALGSLPVTVSLLALALILEVFSVPKGD